MSSDLEEQKKAILPFMQRAQEIQQADPKVAYYCRMYAVDQALKLPQRAKEVTALLSATLNQLERDKAQIKLDPVADRIHCLGFALRIFDNADRVDRAGRATERTAVAYYAASVFVEILNQFEGGVDADLLEKQRYCAWRAAEIRKALREGRQPTPPPSANPLPAATSEGGNAATSADLPPASGSSAWAYGGQSQPHALPPPPLPPVPPARGGGEDAMGGEGFGSSDSSFRSTGGDSFVYPRPPPPSVSSSFGRPESPMGQAAAASGGPARFWPGAKLLVHTEEGLDVGGEGGLSSGGGGGGGGGVHPPGTQVGTVGQVVRRPDGGFSYKVALTDRLVEVPEEAAVAALREGDVACMALGHQQTQPFTVKVLRINYASWPPTYLVQTPDGKEQGYGSIAVPPSTAALPPGYKPPVQMIMDAQKQAKYAVSALSFEDIPTAVKHLSEALRLLTSPPPPSAAANLTMPR
ncbi:hypothetical protein VOLCADRAFT_118821 [Volvox carteri f. nagariensis]|uniref:Vta1/callose synthase N-terminal domain-containing protein n=1 Tax=Volvox carteri f. nagariensis TaxID=3068 RepID=D8U7P3_VOLCA|nr:uncharacterized protein VOLCADRAFT_118821 [Volvox carteri f. nagariensis]EFJ44337.1 hypothetical protein VOLCADRAFT_118821 [Volvox carteri f. nagariensis]|eukprot:XP_002954696.1 hypothetical protein VOLCADRAFT_118821 [Volvox carteri f. nagariensis]